MCPPATAKTGDQPLEVPFPRARRHLVEIVQIEDQLAFRRRKAAEVQQMRIAADRKRDTRIGRTAQIMGLQDRASPIEGERRHGHPSVAKRNERVDTASAVGLQKCHRIALDVARRAVFRAFYAFAGRPSPRPPLLDSLYRHVRPRSLNTGYVIGA
jgi:hypothetical protein